MTDLLRSADHMLLMAELEKEKKMSYCRFSSDDWTCDVYVYEAAEGVCIDVASARHVGIPKLPPFENTNEWWTKYQDQMKVVSSAELVDIGLPLDGKDFYGLAYQEAFDKLTEIKSLGYNVPNYVFEALQEDINAS